MNESKSIRDGVEKDKDEMSEREEKEQDQF